MGPSAVNVRPVWECQSAYLLAHRFSPPATFTRLIANVGASTALVAFHASLTPAAAGMFSILRGSAASNMPVCLRWLPMTWGPILSLQGGGGEVKQLGEAGGISRACLPPGPGAASAG